MENNAIGRTMETRAEERVGQVSTLGGVLADSVAKNLTVVEERSTKATRSIFAEVSMSSMSIEAIQDYSPSTAMVLHKIANLTVSKKAFIRDGEAWIKINQDKLANMLSRGKSTIKKAVSDLKKDGIIKVVAEYIGERDGQRQYCNCYCVTEKGEQYLFRTDREKLAYKKGYQKRSIGLKNSPSYNDNNIINIDNEEFEEDRAKDESVELNNEIDFDEEVSVETGRSLESIKDEAQYQSRDQMAYWIYSLYSVINGLFSKNGEIIDSKNRVQEASNQLSGLNSDLMAQVGTLKGKLRNVSKGVTSSQYTSSYDPEFSNAMARARAAGERYNKEKQDTSKQTTTQEEDMEHKSPAWLDRDLKAREQKEISKKMDEVHEEIVYDSKAKTSGEIDDEIQDIFEKHRGKGGKTTAWQDPNKKDNDKSDREKDLDRKVQASMEASNDFVTQCLKR